MSAAVARSLRLRGRECEPWQHLWVYQRWHRPLMEEQGPHPEGADDLTEQQVVVFSAVGVDGPA